jgi:ankyrin repeat protein
MQAKAPVATKAIIWFSAGVACLWLAVTLLMPALNTALLRHELAGSGNGHRLLQLVDAGADPDTRTNDGQTPLMWASRRGDRAIVVGLLKREADPSLRDVGGRTALIYSIQERNPEVASLLIDVMRSDDKQALNDALIYAALAGNLATTRRLLEAGADPNSRAGLHGGTPLLTAVRRSDLALVRLLVMHGADPDLADAAGQSPLGLALASRPAQDSVQASGDIRSDDHDRLIELLEARLAE